MGAVVRRRGTQLAVRQQRTGARAAGGGLAAAVLLLAVGACSADPPAPARSSGSSSTAVAAPVANSVVIAVDDVGRGFNTHLLTGQSQAATAVSSLVLPSPFRPVTDPARPGSVNLVADSTLVASAEVTSQSPFIVTYQLRNEASWSDGAPIAAEDFRYLWQQMTTHQGVVDEAGYRLIEDVESAGGGKTVKVKMKAPYPGWRGLFSNLLPSHVVKDQGFEGLEENLPLSGTQFRVKRVDLERAEIRLERNDRFWGTPAKLDQILIRRGGSPSQVVDAIRSGDAQVAQVRATANTAARLNTLPGVRVGSAVQPRVLQLALNSRSGELADIRMRRGILNLLDARLLAAVAAGVADPPNLALAQVFSPSTPGYQPKAPARLPEDAALALLAEAGYRPGPATAPVNPPAVQARPVLLKDEQKLKFRIGASANDQGTIDVANAAADMLRLRGVDASVKAVPPSELYGAALVDKTVDAVIGWTAAIADPATALASRFSCPPPSVLPSGQADPQARAPGNISGVCDPALQPAIDAALRGGPDAGKTVADAEARLWDLAAVLPIVQDSSLVAIGPGINGVSLTNPIVPGIFGGAAQWTRAGR